MSEVPRKFPGIPGSPKIQQVVPLIICATYCVQQAASGWSVEGPERRSKDAAIRAWNKAVNAALAAGEWGHVA